jgi:glycosyltransferase involved in cell wall biosynthesis
MSPAHPEYQSDSTRPPARSQQRLLSIIIPCHNEEAVIEATHARLCGIAPAVGMPLEVIYIDDGSRDRTLERLQRIAAADPRVTVLELSRNFGQQAAMSAGLEQARGDAVVIIDADLQDPPEVIPEMVARWRDGVDVVYGRRRRRVGETAFKLITASLFHRFFASLMPYPMPVDTGDFKLCDRAVIDAVCSLPEKRRYLRNLVPWAGFHHEPVWYDRDARPAGETKYSPRKLLALAADAVVLSSDKPLRLTWLAAGILGLAGLTGLLATAASSGQQTATLPAVLAVVGLIAAVQTAAIALVGEYVVRGYRETQGRPPYVIRQTISGGTGAATSADTPHFRRQDAA